MINTGTTQRHASGGQRGRARLARCRVYNYWAQGWRPASEAVSTTTGRARRIGSRPRAFCCIYSLCRVPCPSPTPQRGTRDDLDEMARPPPRRRHRRGPSPRPPPRARTAERDRGRSATVYDLSRVPCASPTPQRAEPHLDEMARPPPHRRRPVGQLYKRRAWRVVREASMAARRKGRPVCVGCSWERLATIGKPEKCSTCSAQEWLVRRASGRRAKERGPSPAAEPEPEAAEPEPEAATSPIPSGTTLTTLRVVRNGARRRVLTAEELRTHRLTEYFTTR